MALPSNTSRDCPSRSALRQNSPRLLRPLLTSRSASSASPFQARGEITPGKNAILHRTTAAFTSPGPWPRELRSRLPARPGQRRLRCGSCTSAHGLRSTLPPHARSPSRSCASLASLSPARPRTSTRRSRPCGAHKQKGPSSLTRGLANISLTMSYFHTGTRTIIGAEAFHCPVRDGKEWDHLAMVIRLNLLPSWGLRSKTTNSQSIESAFDCVAQFRA